MIEYSVQPTAEMPAGGATGSTTCTPATATLYKGKVKSRQRAAAEPCE